MTAVSSRAETETGGLLLAERDEVDRCRVPQLRVVGMMFEQLGAGGADHEQRDGLGHIGQVFEEGEHRRIRPVQVLEHEDGGVLLGEVLEEPSPRGEQLLPLGGGGRFDAEQREQALAEPGALFSSGQHRLELGGGDRGHVGIHDSGVGLQDLPERPERDALPVWEAATLTPGDELGLRVDVAEELGYDATLAESGFTHHGHELR